MNAPHCYTCSCAGIGYVQQTRWGEWEAVCAVARCGWRHSQGNRTQVDAEERLRSHSSLVHPPRIPIFGTPSESGGES